jgi:hypothetical protein
MIEIAISLAVIGFALVAIIGILPTGMNVQKENRQETIIGNDASILMNALRNGERGLDDLTNYVRAITNWAQQYNPNGSPVAGGKHVAGFTYSNSILDGTVGSFAISNGFRIIGLLGTPKLARLPQGGFMSNHVVAFVRSISGPASEKFPQSNPSVEELGLNYRLIADVTPYSTNFFDPIWTNYGAAAGNTNLIVARSNYMHLVWQFQTNLHDVRLTFRWPLLPSGDAGPGRQVFRTTVGGSVLVTNEPGFNFPEQTLYFLQPRTYAKAP